jgi:hypothetical protein
MDLPKLAAPNRPVVGANDKPNVNTFAKRRDEQVAKNLKSEDFESEITGEREFRAMEISAEMDKERELAKATWKSLYKPKYENYFIANMPCPIEGFELLKLKHLGIKEMIQHEVKINRYASLFTITIPGLFKERALMEKVTAEYHLHELFYKKVPETGQSILQGVFGEEEPMELFIAATNYFFEEMDFHYIERKGIYRIVPKGVEKYESGYDFTKELFEAMKKGVQALMGTKDMTKGDDTSGDSEYVAKRRQIVEENKRFEAERNAVTTAGMVMMCSNEFSQPFDTITEKWSYWLLMKQYEVALSKSVYDESYGYFVSQKFEQKKGAKLDHWRSVSMLKPRKESQTM